MNFTEFEKCSLIFIMTFSTLILTKKLQSHFFIVTETLNSDKSDSSHCYSVSEAATVHCSHCFNIVHTKLDCSNVLQQTVQNLKICRRKNVILYEHVNNVVLNFTEF